MCVRYICSTWRLKEEKRKKKRGIHITTYDRLIFWWRAAYAALQTRRPPLTSPCMRQHFHSGTVNSVPSLLFRCTGSSIAAPMIKSYPSSPENVKTALGKKFRSHKPGRNENYSKKAMRSQFSSRLNKLNVAWNSVIGLPSIHTPFHRPLSRKL